MPTYVYKFVKTGETIEVQQAFDQDTLTKYKHPETGRTMAVKKVFQPVGVTFKGSGFFKTDNRASANGSSNGTSDAASGSESTGTTSSDSKGATTSDSTSTTTPNSTSKTDTPAKKPAKAAASASGSD